MSRFFLSGLMLLGLMLRPTLSSSNEQECEATRLTEPTGVIAERQPIIAWTAVGNADFYRVELESRVPEGKTLVRLDARVSAISFRPPQPLTDFRAHVTVKVTPHCRMGSAPAPAAFRFRIDTAALCSLAPERMSLDRRDNLIKWEPVARANHYQVSIFAGTESTLVLKREGLAPEVRLPPATGPVIVAIRPWCSTGWGEMVYFPVLGE